MTSKAGFGLIPNPIVNSSSLASIFKYYFYLLAVYGSAPTLTWWTQPLQIPSSWLSSVAASKSSYSWGVGYLPRQLCLTLAANSLVILGQSS